MGDLPEDHFAQGTQADKPVDLDRVEVRLATLLRTYGLTAHKALRLLSREELANLPGFGPALSHELLSFCGWSGIEFRGVELIVPRALLLYGSIMNAPVVPVLGVVFRKREGQVYKVNKGDFVTIHNAVKTLQVKTVGDLVALLTIQPDIPGVPDEAQAEIRKWMGVNLFRW